jgi:3-oxoacyl-[acyl-carrier-protein] synthase II
VTGIGVVTSLGQGLQDNWRSLTAGQSGIRAIKRFPTAHLRTTIAGMVDFLNADSPSGAELSFIAAGIAAEEAIAMAGIGTVGDFPGPLFAATPPVEMEWSSRRRIFANVEGGAGDAYLRMASLKRSANDNAEYEQTLFGYVAGRLAEKIGTRGAPIALSTACASGATAIQLGVEAIRRGDCAAALCVGTDCSVNAESVIRFSLLSALSSSNEVPEEASKPFSKNRDGFVIAEGAGALVLEDYDAAVARGAEILGIVRGIAEKADDFHRTRSKPDGSAIIGAIRDTIADAGLSPDAIDYVNAHGTGTPENDKMEAMSLEAVLGERVRQIPISSNKSMIGHTLSAAGAIEAAVTVATIRSGVIPPTINYRVPDPAIEIDCVPNTARNARISVALSNSFGFGGQNACLVISAEPA